MTRKLIIAVALAVAAAVGAGAAPEDANAYARYSDGRFASVSLTVVPYGSVARDLTFVMESNVPFSFRVRTYDPLTRTETWSVWRSSNGFAIIPNIVTTGAARWYRHAVQYARPGFPTVSEWMTVRHCTFGICDTRTDGWALY